MQKRGRGDDAVWHVRNVLAGNLPHHDCHVFVDRYVP